MVIKNVGQYIIIIKGNFSVTRHEFTSELNCKAKDCPSYLASMAVVILWKFDLFLSILIRKINKT